MTDRITVGEERLRQLFAEFKLELFELLGKKASQESHDALASRVSSLELWQAGLMASTTTREKITAKQLAVWGVAGTVFAGVLAAIATLVWLAVGG